MKKIFTYFFLPLFLLSFSSCMVSRDDSTRIAMEKNKEKLGKSKCCDTKFAVFAADGEMFINKASALAATNASSPEVKNIAEQLVSTHTASYNKLELIAASKNISLPAKLSGHSQKIIDKLSRKTGKDFDKAYLHCMKGDHKRGLHFLKRESQKGKDTELKAWAAEKVPVIEKHYDLIKETCAKVK